MLRLWGFLTTNVWTIFSVGTALYFLWVFHQHAGFPPTEPLTTTSAIYLGLFILFLLAPFIQRFRLGRFIEFEAKVAEVKSDINDVRTETRELISTVSTVATAISASVKQSVVFNFASPEWAQAVREEMSAVFGDAADAAGHEQENRAYMGLAESDPSFALARLRMDIESELRRILGKRVITDDPAKMRSRFLSARSLFRTLASTNPKYQQMRSSFDYVLEACNAAIHGQRIPDGVAHEAVGMGLRILRELQREEGP